MSTLIAAVLLASSQAWVAPISRLDASRCKTVTRSSPSVLMTGKGFGKPKPAPKKAVKPPSEDKVRRDQASEDLDRLKKQGSPEYTVLVRTVDAAGEASKWYPVGGLAVPRSSSEDQALSLAIFNNEDDLLKGAFRSYPFLKKSTDKFEYGYRLQEFADDPIKLASKEASEQASNPITQWFNALDNPLNDGSGWFNPLNRS